MLMYCLNPIYPKFKVIFYQWILRLSFKIRNITQNRETGVLEARVREKGYT